MHVHAEYSLHDGGQINQPERHMQKEIPSLLVISQLSVNIGNVAKCNVAVNPCLIESINKLLAYAR